MNAQRSRASGRKEKDTQESGIEAKSRPISHHKGKSVFLILPKGAFSFGLLVLISEDPWGMGYLFVRSLSLSRTAGFFDQRILSHQAL